MTLDYALMARIKAEILRFTTVEVEQFLLAHPDKTFYAFAFDTHAEYAELNLCFNTEVDFQQRLAYYQSGEFAASYQSPEAIQELKFNTGDWEYQCFSTCYLLSGAVFTECLVQFTQTEVYQAIPKTDGFMAFSIDHDEDVADMLAARCS